MATPSKEEEILKLILENSPLKHWHFEDIIKQAGVTRAIGNKWLRRYCDEGLLLKIKEKGRFPYFTAGSNNLVYQSKKRIYALEKMYQSGLISHLAGLQNAKTVIIFGSMIKGDWYKESDIDIFIYGSPAGMEKHKYELRLKKGIEIHAFQTRKDIKEVRTGLINNVINGYVVKGRINDFAEVN